MNVSSVSSTPTDRLTARAREFGLDRADVAIPAALPAMTIGLFGGSFNPPHGGHLLVAETALQRLRLDQVWWMVTPGNPLKDPGELAPLAERIRQSRALTRNPKIIVCAPEAGFRTRYSADTIQTILARRSGVRFVWIMGADNLRTFHLWQDWRRIVHSIPIAVIDRPGSTLSHISAPMARTFAHARIDEDDAALIARKSAPAWTFIHGPRSSLSSTALRAKPK